MNDLVIPDDQDSTLQSILALAKQGDPKAMAALINDALNPRGITAKVGWKDGCLGILLESTPVPDQDEMVAWIQQSIARLNSGVFRRLKICGYQPGHSLPAWYEEIEWDSAQELASGADYGVPSLISWLNQGEAPRPAAAIEGSDRSLHPASGAAQFPLPPAASPTPNQRFLRFYLTSEETALLPLHQVREVLKVPIAEILPVPHLPDCILGVYNWRGEMLWLVDVAQQLGFASSLVNGRVADPFPTLVTQTDRQSLGLVVSQVSDIETYMLQQMQPPSPGLFPSKLSSFMQGYFATRKSPVLNPAALIHDPLLQVHCPH